MLYVGSKSWDVKNLSKPYTEDFMTEIEYLVLSVINRETIWVSSKLVVIIIVIIIIDTHEINLKF